MKKEGFRVIENNASLVGTRAFLNPEEIEAFIFYKKVKRQIMFTALNIISSY